MKRVKPFTKLKYVYMIDRESIVRERWKATWWKSSEKNLKNINDKHFELREWGGTFCIMGQRVI